MQHTIQYSADQIGALRQILEARCGGDFNMASASLNIWQSTEQQIRTSLSEPATAPVPAQSELALVSN